MKIGVLALQGDFQEHCEVLRKLRVECVEVRLPEHLTGLDGLIIPGGESTTIAKLAVTFGLLEPLRDLANTLPIWGTCCGLVFMARNVGTDQPVMGIMDMVVQRNAFGRQVNSFEADLLIDGLPGGPFHGIFIRAPLIEEVGPGVDTICRLADGRIVAARQGRKLVTAFHPELAGDDRVHRYFLDIVAEASKERAGT